MCHDPPVLIFATAIGLSAFLLFWIEPLIGQIVLPVFGGTPAAWATVLVFFQVEVLLGYLYGHASVTRLGPRRGAIVHLVLLGLAIGWLVLMPVRPAELQTSELPAAIDVLRLLVLAVGLPVILLTATTPLVSAWFVASQRRRERAAPAGDPYRLYALSNAASLGALLGYPLVIGRLVGLSRQTEIWAIGFIILSAALGLAALMVVRGAGRRMLDAAPEALAPSMKGSVTVDAVADIDGPADAGDRGATHEDAATSEDDTGPRRSRRLAWVLLAAVPSGLLAAVTNVISVDLIAAPLLWIGPLAIYLGSFIVAFSERGRRVVPLAVSLAPAAITLLWIPTGSVGGWPILPFIALEWAGLAVVATALHGRLAQDRPPPARLTEFYLVQSIGGVVGGAFVALVAPTFFDGVWELPILLVAALVALAVTGSRPERLGDRIRDAPPRRGVLDLRPFVDGAVARLAPFVVVAVAITALMVVEGSIATPVVVRWFLVGGLILLVGGPPRFMVLSTAAVLALATFVLPSPALFADRSFFGVSTVTRTPDGRWTELMNGTTVHGTQSTDPVLALQPTFYYAASGPLGDVFRELALDRPAGAAIGVVGLGTGAVAAYVQPGQSMTFFEIDPVVVRVATDPRYFTYLAETPTVPRIVLGDGRISLRNEPDASFDLLVLDAFSSDAVPAHLLTVEALLDDRRVLRSGGVLAIHVSNRYYDLAPALGAAGARLGMTVLERRYSPTPEESDAGAGPSIWVVATSDAATAGRFRAAGWRETRHEGIEALTDDRPDVLRFLVLDP